MPPQPTKSGATPCLPSAVRETHQLVTPLQVWEPVLPQLRLLILLDKGTLSLAQTQECRTQLGKRIRFLAITAARRTRLVMETHSLDFTPAVVPRAILTPSWRKCRKL